METMNELNLENELRQIRQKKEIPDLFSMRDPKRVNRLLNLVRKIWEYEFDSRLGQLLVNALLQHPRLYILIENNPACIAIIRQISDEDWEEALRLQLVNYYKKY